MKKNSHEAAIRKAVRFADRFLLFNNTITIGTHKLFVNRCANRFRKVVSGTKIRAPLFLFYLIAEANKRNNKNLDPRDSVMLAIAFITVRISKHDFLYFLFGDYKLDLGQVRNWLKDETVPFSNSFDLQLRTVKKLKDKGWFIPNFELKVLEYEVINRSLDIGISRKTTLRLWRKIRPSVYRIKSNPAHFYLACFKYAAIFKDQPEVGLGFINNPNLARGLHDLVIPVSLHRPLTKEEYAWLKKYKRQLRGKPLDYIQAYSRLKTESDISFDLLSTKPKELKELSYKLTYSNVKYPILAKACSLNSRSSYAFENYQNTWETWFNNRELFDGIPGGFMFKSKSGFTIRQLDNGDPMASVIGDLTDCCQHINGVGEPCARHSVISGNGSVWVVEDKDGEVVSQAWVWRNNDKLVLDSIEGSPKKNYLKEVSDLFYQACKQAKGRLLIKSVYVGSSSVPIKTKGKKVKRSFSIPGYTGYSDSQYISKII